MSGDNASKGKENIFCRNTLCCLCCLGSFEPSVNCKLLVQSVVLGYIQYFICIAKTKPVSVLFVHSERNAAQVERGFHG